MKKALFLTIAGLASILPVSAGTVVFKGVTLTYDSALGTVVNNPNGSITATQAAGSSAEFDLEVMSGFRNASFSYSDNINTNIDLFQQRLGGLNPRIQIGSAFSSNGQIDYERYNNPAIENIDFVTFSRIDGASHTVGDSVNPDGSITFSNDGSVTTGVFLKNNVAGFSGFDDTLLRIRSRLNTTGNSVTFTDLSLSNASAAPEPATLALVFGGLGLVGFAKRRSQRQYFQTLSSR